MKDIIKGKFFTILTITATIILAGIAIFTAFRLYQLRQESVSMTQPESEPKAQTSSQNQLISCTLLAFSLTQSTPTATITPSTTGTPTPTTINTPTPTIITPTPTDRPIGGSSPTPTLTPTVPAICNQSCTNNADCQDNLVCSNNRCRNINCPNETDCQCPSSTTSAVQATPTPGGLTLPDAGISTPTLFGLSLGTLLIVAAFLLAF